MTRILKNNSVLEEVLKKIEPSREEFDKLNEIMNDFSNKIKKRINSSKINAEFFVGGSFAKKTIVKKDKYDIDVFIRFDKSYRGKDISKLTKRLLKDFKDVKKIHGSRDYFNIRMDKNIFVEVIPVLKVKNPKNAENITDLSYYHVKYINKKIKSDRMLKDIILAKSFCYANKCYGAESYIGGFSGYSLELLIVYYGSFLKFLKAISKSEIPKSNDKKIIIDIEKHHKRKRILLDLNASKLKSPIILIDPTFKQRNVLAALSNEKFKIFKKASEEFLKEPTMQKFIPKELNSGKAKKEAKEKGLDFVLLESKTNKQEGDIAGSKLLKFYKHLYNEIGRFFKIKNSNFEYNGKKGAKYYFVAKNKGEQIVQGPLIKDKENTKKFKKKHKKTFNKKGRVYASEKFEDGLKDFIKLWEKKNSKRLKEMDITSFNLKDSLGN